MQESCFENYVGKVLKITCFVNNLFCLVLFAASERHNLTAFSNICLEFLKERSNLRTIFSFACVFSEKLNVIVEMF